MTIPMPEFRTLSVRPGPVHEPEASDREPKTRHKLLFWDRAKVFVVLTVIMVFSIAIKHDDVPIMSWGAAARDQVNAKGWLFLLAAAEAIRQLHLLISERSAGYHQTWERRVWGAWDRRMSRLNPWMRYRLGRLVKVITVMVIALFLFSAIWKVSFFDAVLQAPGRLWTNPLGGAGLPWFFQLGFAFFYIVIQFVGMFWFLSKGGIDTYMPQEVKTRFADVWGQDKVLNKVKENIILLEKPAEIEGRGGHVPSGILLWGPPGTGKTLMAEAVAGETGRPYVFVDPGAFTQMFMGVGILKVKSLFRKLRKLALKYGGVIVFFDEADSLGSRGAGVVGKAPNAQEWDALRASQCCNGLSYLSPATSSLLVSQQLAEVRARAAALASPAEAAAGLGRLRPIIAGMGMGGGGGSGTLQALLTELSGLKKPRGVITRRLRAFLSMKPKQPPKYRILVMMATNLPSALDEALLRPGRIDRMYKVDYPTLEGRIRTFEGYFDKVRHNLTRDHIERLATMSPRASGAVIKDIVNEALIAAIRDGRDTVTWPDVLEAKTFKVHGLADGPASTELEQHETAIHEAGHAVAQYLLRRREAIDIATIEQRGDIGGFVSPVPIEERKFNWRVEWEEDIMVSLSSLVAERLFFDGDNSSGVGGDMNNSTNSVRAMLARAAMGDTLTSHHLDDLGMTGRNDFDLRVEAKLKELFERAEKVISQNRWFLVSIAHALQAHRTITGEDIDAIYKGTRGPTLDGAPYHTEGFRSAMLQYLAAAAEAHRSQSKLTYPLPRFEQPAPVAVEAPSWLSGAPTGNGQPAPTPPTGGGWVMPPVLSPMPAPAPHAGPPTTGQWPAQPPLQPPPPGTPPSGLS